MVKHASFTLASHLEKVTEILEWVRAQVTDKQLYPQEERKIELALEEAVVNIIRHSYNNQQGEVNITIHDENPKELTFVIKDSGPPFDPLAHTEMIQAENRVGEKSGGLGVLLMCRAMDHVHYKREGGFNILSLTKTLRLH